MYDLIVLGGGPGGYEIAAYAGGRGLSVALVEKNYLGGTCLNEGCIPLKYFLHASKAVKEISNLKATGLCEGTDNIRVLQRNVVSNKDAIVEGLRQSVGAKLEFNKVEVISGLGKVAAADENQVKVEVNGNIIEAKTLVIATGSSERHIPFSGSASIPVIYSSDFLKLSEIPERMAVIGAGVIGLEAASYFADLGTKVTLIDVVNKVGGAIDSEIEKAYERILKKSGLTLALGKGVTAINGNKVMLEGGDSVETDLCLVAVGRSANVEGIGLEEAGIIYDKKGIAIDDHCRTNLKNVYAIGDCTGKLMLAHTAYHQALVAIENICGKDEVTRYHEIPSVIYANPEITTVGLTEDACKEAGISYVAKSIPMTYSGKYYAEHGRDGAIIKLIADEKGSVIGASLIGNGGSEIGIFLELIIKNKNTVEDLKALVYPHPTMGEVIKELAEQF